MDGLRAVAVAGVVLDHAFDDLLPGGFLGVDVFFVISGYVITRSYVARYESLGVGSMIDFWARRVKRLFPALLLCVAVTYLVSLMVLPPDTVFSDSVLRAGVASVFALSNFYLLRQSADYFGSTVESNPFTHTWSLGVEEQFYFAFPLLVWIVGRSTSRELLEDRLAAVIAVLVVTSLCVYLVVHVFDPLSSFYLMPLRAWELGAGMLLALREQDGAARSRNGPVIAACSLLVICLLFGLGGHVVPVAPATILTTMATALLIRSIDGGASVGRLMRMAVFQWIGHRSYAIYLWHWPPIALASWMYARSVQQGVFLVILGVFLGALSYALVERRLRYVSWSLVGEGRIGAGAGLVVWGCVAALVLVVHVSWFEPRMHRGEFYAGRVASIEQRGAASIEHPDFREGLTWSPETCVGEGLGTARDPITDCALAQRRPDRPVLAVIGDSYALAQALMVEPLQGRYDVVLTSTYGSGPTQASRVKPERQTDHDRYWEQDVPRVLAGLGDGDVLLMLFDGALFAEPGAEARLQALEAGLDEFAEALAERGVSVVYQASLPYLRDSGCTLDMALPQPWNEGLSSPCRYLSRQATVARAGPYRETLERTAGQHVNFVVLDLLGVVCPGDICRHYDEDGVFLFRDEFTHLSPEGARRAYGSLAEAVTSLERRGVGR